MGEHCPRNAVELCNEGGFSLEEHGFPCNRSQKVYNKWWGRLQGEKERTVSWARKVNAILENWILSLPLSDTSIKVVRVDPSLYVPLFLVLKQLGLSLLYTEMFCALNSIWSQLKLGFLLLMNGRNAEYSGKSKARLFLISLSTILTLLLLCLRLFICKLRIKILRNFWDLRFTIYE